GFIAHQDCCAKALPLNFPCQVVDHYENPRNVGSLDKSAKNVGTGLVGAPACGDVMKLQVQVDENGKIIDARFKTFGCGSAIASSSLATEWVKGKTVDEALKIRNTDIAKELCLPPVKLHCSSPGLKQTQSDASGDRKPFSPACKDRQEKHCHLKTSPSPSMVVSARAQLRDCPDRIE
ncbi:hypothetical protein JD844_015240, partial [Phrynosoma platyrhinos]